MNEFLNDLPALEEGGTFDFGCHPGISCFNACCADLDLRLSPYDVLRLREALGLSSAAFMSRHGRVGIEENSGLPLVFLRMRDDRKRPCPFVSGEGCVVYPDRPGACRMYPLGRGTSLQSSDPRYVVVREEHCRGFESDNTWTAAGWLEDQGLGEYVRFDDQTMGLYGRVRELGVQLDRDQTGMILFALYHLDDFAARIGERGWLTRTPMPEDQKQAILQGGDKTLSFGYVWLERTLLAPCAQGSTSS
jgi:Fe-S-cluster containining protein